MLAKQAKNDFKQTLHFPPSLSHTARGAVAELGEALATGLTVVSGWAAV
jgi:hypothetical protein